MSYGGIYVVYGLTDLNGRFKHYLRCDSAIELYSFFSYPVSNAGLKTAQALLLLERSPASTLCSHLFLLSHASMLRLLRFHPLVSAPQRDDPRSGCFEGLCNRGLGHPLWMTLYRSIHSSSTTAVFLLALVGACSSSICVYLPLYSPK